MGGNLSITYNSLAFSIVNMIRINIGVCYYLNNSIKQQLQYENKQNECLFCFLVKMGKFVFCPIQLNGECDERKD